MAKLSWLSAGALLRVGAAAEADGRGLVECGGLAVTHLLAREEHHLDFGGNILQAIAQRVEPRVATLLVLGVQRVVLADGIARRILHGKELQTVREILLRKYLEERARRIGSKHGIDLRAFSVQVHGIGRVCGPREIRERAVRAKRKRFSVKPTINLVARTLRYGNRRLFSFNLSKNADYVFGCKIRMSLRNIFA